MLCWCTLQIRAWCRRLRYGGGFPSWLSVLGDTCGCDASTTPLGMDAMGNAELLIKHKVVDRSERNVRESDTYE